MSAPGRLSAAMQAAAKAYLISVGDDARRYTVSVTTRTRKHFFRGGGEDGRCVLDGACTCGRGCVRVVPGTAPADGLPPFSPTELLILVKLCETGWVSTDALRQSLPDCPVCETDFRVIVRNLAERGAVETSNKSGVRVTGAGRDAAGRYAAN